MDIKFLIESHNMVPGDVGYIVTWNIPEKTHTPLIVIFKQSETCPIMIGTINLIIGDLVIKAELFEDLRSQTNDIDRVLIKITKGEDEPIPVAVFYSNGHTFSNIDDIMAIKSFIV